MILETKRLILRPWEESDAESLYKYAKDAQVGPIAGWPPHRSVDESLDVIRNVFNGQECYAICLKTDNVAIGCIELKLKGHTDMTERDDECELGFWIGVPFWGKGIVPEAARRLIRHGFDDLGMITIWCGYYDGNEKSKRVQEKCGFIYHHSCNEVPVPLMGETRIGHTNILTREQWKAGLIVRSLTEREKPAACELAWKVFLKYEAPEYSQEGINEFRNTLDNKDFIGRMRFYGAFQHEKLVGTLAMRQPQHISLLFVDEEYHKKGIGRKLFERMKQDYEKQEFTVNSSPYAVEAYKHLGFVPTGTEQTVNGIRFIPMKYGEWNI
jgi:RimJ/RimL family protein N-acetyltransferase/GNAT superfamily N-acetyltransferase